MDEPIPKLSSSDPASTSTSTLITMDHPDSVTSPVSDPLIPYKETATDAALTEEKDVMETDKDSTHLPLTASQQILEGFPKMPAELRDMVYTAMVNKPRLLIFRNIRWNLYTGTPLFSERVRDYENRLSVARLPSTFLLNKEAYNATKRNITLVPNVNKQNVDDFPYSYINPMFDVGYVTFPSNFRTATADQVPGLQILAVDLGDRQVLDGQYERLHEAGLVASGLQDLPDVKEVLLVRRLEWPSTIRRTLESKVHGYGYVWKSSDVPDIQRHHCGFFGIPNSDVEEFLSESLRYLNIPMTSGVEETFKSSKQICDEAVRDLTAVNDAKYPGTKLPHISVVYNIWQGANGIWQKPGKFGVINEQDELPQQY